ncbi:histidine kinase osmosensor [Marasmius crinis-equi]|uniref:Histidine kinase osmosensor n=1 Tax=Marasmius crinis-equi TaxID=585013 RepID=A0ABR3FJG9_9AGAR
MSPPIPSSPSNSSMDAFLDHLDRLVSYYEVPLSCSAPTCPWTFEEDWRMSSILRSVERIAGRMRRAERALSEREVRISEEEEERKPKPKPKGKSTYKKRERKLVGGNGLKLDLGGLRGGCGDTGMGPGWRMNTTSVSERKALQSKTPFFAAGEGEPAASMKVEEYHGIEGKENWNTCAIGTESGSLDLVLAAPIELSYGIGTRCLELDAATFYSVPSDASLATAGANSGLNAVEELKLLKMQVSDVARVCNAVADGDLSHRITASVDGAVMVVLKDVVNVMVENLQQFVNQVRGPEKAVPEQGKGLKGTWIQLVDDLAAHRVAS